MRLDHAIRLRDMAHKAAELLPDSDALEAVELFEPWAAGIEYLQDKRLRYCGKLYKVLQAHTSQANWIPGEIPSLYTEVAEPGEIPVWRQPTGAQDAYQTGDMVYYPDKDGNIYRSVIDNNTWSPEQFPQGWELIEDE